MQPVTKISQVRAAMAAGDWRKAISIASKMQELGPQREAITRAQSVYLRPGFYAGMGRDEAAILKAGMAACIERFAEKPPADMRRKTGPAKGAK